MKILGWNVRSCGPARATNVARAIEAQRPDVVVLTEYQPASAAVLARLLDRSGFIYAAETSPTVHRGGVAIRSSIPFDIHHTPPALVPFGERYLRISLKDEELDILGIYGPLHKDSYRQFWSTLLENLRENRAIAFVIIGDLNSGLHLIDTSAPRMLASSFFRGLPDAGYTDLWRHMHGSDTREYSWEGRTHPYRLDHALGTASVLPRLKNCWYSHAERLAGYSDHSMLLVDIDPRSDCQP